jgi:hypothetical protein
MTKRLTTPASALLFALPLIAAGQTVTFPNATPPATVRLEAGSQVSMDASNNFVMRCDATDPAGCARLMQGGGGTGSCTGQCGTGATFTSPLAVINPSLPPAPGPYPGGSALTVSAQVAGASVCVPSALQGATSVSITGWTGALFPVGNTITQGIILPTQPGSTYTLRLICYGATGSAISERTVATATQVNPPPTDCPTQFPTSSAYTSAAAGAMAPTQINGVTINNVDGLETLVNVLGFNVNPFPTTGTPGNLIGSWHNIRVIRFTVPNPFPQGSFLRRFLFTSSPNGFVGGTDAYMSVSTCPGDLRIPTATQSGTADDPTYAESCRTWRGNSWTFEDTGQADLPYVVGSAGQSSPSTPASCVLQPGRVYFLNIFMSKPNRATRSLTPTSPICTWFECGHAVSAGG